MKTFVFCIRMSAIGDAIMCHQTLRLLKKRGAEPILVTDPSLKAVALQFDFLSYVATFSENKLTVYRISDIKAEVTGAARKFLELTEQDTCLIENNYHILDLQVTRRSKRTYQAIKGLCRRLNKTSAVSPTIWKVNKNTFLRIWLVMAARFKSFLYGQIKTTQSAIFTRAPRNSVPLNQQKAAEKLLNYVGSQAKLSTSIEENNSAKHPDVRKDECIWVGKDVSKEDEGAYIALVPGASSFTKQWPKENFAAIISLILQHTNFKVIICGGAAEKNLGEYLSKPNGVEHKSIKNYTGALTLEETFEKIKQSRFLLSCDTFATHLADLHGIPGVVIFGSTSPDFGFVPTGNTVKVLYSSLSCSPCTRHGKSPCRFANLACLRSISPQEVFSIIQDSLTKS